MHWYIYDRNRIVVFASVSGRQVQSALNYRSSHPFLNNRTAELFFASKDNHCSCKKKKKKKNLCVFSLSDAWHFHPRLIRRLSFFHSVLSAPR